MLSDTTVYLIKVSFKTHPSLRNPALSVARQVNTTVSVSSSLVNSTNKLVNFGTFGKYLGAAGFSLVNVSNVPLQLGDLKINSELLSVNNLVGRAVRHYIKEGLHEAHKVHKSRSSALPSGEGKQRRE